MKLHFLGTVYNHSPRLLETIDSGITGKFHGCAYEIRCPIVARPTMVRNLKYRGVAY
jgi:Domain of unknown function (DUF4278)